MVCKIRKKNPAGDIIIEKNHEPKSNPVGVAEILPKQYLNNPFGFVSLLRSF